MIGKETKVNEEQRATEVEVSAFSEDHEDDIIKIVNAYTADWPYSRPIDASVIAHWKTMGDTFQPHHMLIAYRAGDDGGRSVTGDHHQFVPQRLCVR